MVTAALADDVARRIVEHFHPRRIVLFGSLARGDTREWSDIDLFVEMESDKHPAERAMAIDRIFGLRDWPMDLIVYTPEEVERCRGVRGSFLERIETEGKVLYERPGD